MEVDRNGLNVLGRDECMRLLAGSTFGRIGITSGALPVVLPVNYRLVEGRIAFRTGRGTKLDAATVNSVVAFEVDDIDPLSHAGWSVVVTGVARKVTDPAILQELASAGIPRWAASTDESVVEVGTTMVSGRRIDPW